jgi:phosphonate transport system substrate-binding protein
MKKVVALFTQFSITLLMSLFIWLYSASPLLADSDTKTYKIGLTPVFLADRTSFIHDWQNYLSRKLKTSVKFVQRQTYQEVTDLLMAGDLDAAWLCGFPYVVNKSDFKLLSVPTYKGEPLYQSYLIVPATDKDTKSIEDLKNKVFAYSDPNSNSGYLVPQIDMIKAGINPRTFFNKAFFAWSHQDVVRAVADGVANAGAVDGYVWDTIESIDPRLTSQTRVVTRSQKFGFPPFVVKRGLPSASESALRRSLLDMNNDRDGRALLKRLNIDSFIMGDDELYEGIINLVNILKENR